MSEFINKSIDQRSLRFASPKEMQFRRLGASSLRVPVFSLGGWLTFGGTIKGDPVKDIVKLAFESGECQQLWVYTLH
jgi:hypothetical protein